MGIFSPFRIGIVGSADDRTSFRSVSFNCAINLNKISFLKKGDCFALIASNDLDAPVAYLKVEDAFEGEPETEALLFSAGLAKTLELDIKQLYTVEKITAEMEKKELSAEVVEVTFKQQYIGRIQMWNLKNDLVGKLVFAGEEIVSKKGAILVKISEIRSRSPRLLRCALVTSQTRLVFMSESGKIFLLIQISREMFQPIVNSAFMPIELLVYRLLPLLFGGWMAEKTNHILSVVLFCRVLRNEGSGRGGFEDFFHTLVDWEIAADWTDRLAEIRRAILQFKDRVLQEATALHAPASLSNAYDGNWLEANNLAINIFDKHYIDRDLDRTGLSIINVTAGQAVFSVDFDLTQLSKQKVCDNGIFIHVICLNVPPLYLVPTLVYYYRNEGKRFSELSLEARPSSVIPHWFNCSFYIGEVENDNIFSYARLRRPGFTEVPTEKLLGHLQPPLKAATCYGDVDQWIADLDRPLAQHVQVTRTEVGEGSDPAHPKFSAAEPKKSLLSLKIASTAGAQPPLHECASTGDAGFRSLADVEKLASRYSILQLNRASYGGAAAASLTSSAAAGSSSLGQPAFSARTGLLGRPASGLLSPIRCNLFRNKLGSYCRRWNDVNAHLADDERKAIATDWKVLIRPPCLPIETDFFPSDDELQRDYKEYTYVLHLGQNSPFCKSEHVLETLVSQRLAQGFQIIPFKTVLGMEYFLSLGTEIHILESTSFDTITIKRFLLDNSVVCAFHSAISVDYCFKIRVVEGSGFVQKQSKFVSPSLLQAFNWNYFDYLVAGHNSDLVESLKYWRTRLLLIPMDAPPKHISIALGTAANDVLSPEECRISGFLKLIEQIQDLSLLNRGVKFDHDKVLQHSNRIKVRIISKTIDQLYRENNPMLSLSNSNYPLAPPRRYNSQQLSEAALKVLFDDPLYGLFFYDIKWHCRAHKNLLLGSDFVDWVMVTFEDVCTRRDAVAYGNALIAQGIIEHYYKKHGMLDGFFFYRMGSRFADVKGVAPHSLKNISSSSGVCAGSPSLGSSAEGSASLSLSKMLFINVDTKSQSERCEWAAMHFDTFYNVKSCYHIYLHWLTCTPRILDDFIQSISRKAYHCGFYLVESNANQFSPENEINVFSAPITVKLACSPPIAQLAAATDACGGEACDDSRVLFYSELMRKFGFLLDATADEEFLRGFKICYSFDKPAYSFDQYTHVSGMFHLLVAKSPDVPLFLVKNRLRSTKQSVMSEKREAFNFDAFFRFCSSKSELQAFWDAIYKSLSSKSSSFSFENCALKAKTSRS